jgi:putative ABC transport system substrate-binding protein
MLGIKRREFIAVLGGAAAVAQVLGSTKAHAQLTRKVWRIGFLASAQRPVSIESTSYGGFLQGMRELGYVEGRDFAMEWRFVEGRFELYPVLAAELVRVQVDIVVAGNSAAVRAMQQASSSIPVIVVNANDPVGLGLIASLARPGGNVTGLATSADDTTPKQLELLAKAVPKLSRVGVLSSSDNPNSAPVLKAAQAAALSVGMQLLPIEARTLDDLESAFATLLREHAEALMVVSGGSFPSPSAQQRRVVDLALRARLPTISSIREDVEAGMLMSYGESYKEFNRRAAVYVDKIIRGAKPADLPVQQPTRFFLTINRKTADTLGLTMPLELLVQTDEIIE